ncbi:MAG: hypothetical protein J3R72DRAFT_525548 [Linnemannia gamsii]|nr:MAG: hypothetical protein J3R72DRAFT_525548 [Linnemannia gamsii]
MTWYLKAAKQGFADAQLSIGCMFAAGHGAPQDYSQAAGWYLKAAEQGTADAQCDIGELFETGLGVLQDIVKAKEWYQKATNQGSLKAKKNLEVLERKENPTQPQPSLDKLIFHRIAIFRKTVLDFIARYNFVRIGSTSSYDDLLVTLLTPPLEQMNNEDVNATAAIAVTTIAATNRRNPPCGLVDEAVENYTPIDNPSFLPAPRGPQEYPTIEMTKASTSTMDLPWIGTSRPLSNGIRLDRVRSVSFTVMALALHITLHWPWSGISGQPFKETQTHNASSATYIIKVMMCARIIPKRWIGVQGNAAAQFNIGGMYARDQDVGTEYAEAMEWYQKTEIRNNADAMLQNGVLYNNGCGEPLDLSRAKECLEPRRIAAIPDAVLDIVVSDPLGTTDMASAGVIQPESLSPTWQREEGEETDEESIVSQEASTTAYTRRNPAYGPEDEAMDKYRCNDNPAFRPAPRAPQFIPDIESPPTSDAASDPSKGTKEVSQLIADANLGDSAAQVTLGDRYSKGEGVDQVYQTAMEWYLKAATQGNAHAQNHIGQLYDKGHGMPQDYAQAATWFLKAAEQGHSAAQITIGRMYEEGKGVPRDYSHAMNWYLKAADQGHARAQINIGFLYARGRGVPQDYSHAMHWYLKADDQGDSSAQYNIGVLFDQGRGVPRDYTQAMTWYLKAANQGLAEAQNSLGSMYEEGQGALQDYSQAAGWYLKAADQGNVNAQRYIARLFEKGQGVPQDIVKAKEWYQKAANQGSLKAKTSLEALERKENPMSLEALERKENPMQPQKPYVQKSTKKQGILRKIFQ